MKFKNPQNGHVEKVSALSSWLWGWQNTIWAKGAHSRWMIAGLCLIFVLLIGLKANNTLDNTNSTQTADAFSNPVEVPNANSSPLTLRELGKNCTFWTNWNVSVAFGDTEIPTSVSLTEKELCTMANSLVNRYASALGFALLAQKFPWDELGPAVKTTLQNGKLSIYSVGSFYDGDKRCLGYISVLDVGSAVGSGKDDGMLLWDGTRCKRSGIYDFSMSDKNFDSTLMLGDSYRQHYKYDGALPPIQLKRGEQQRFATNPGIQTEMPVMENDAPRPQPIPANQYAATLLGKWECYDGAIVEYSHDGTYTEWSPPLIGLHPKALYVWLKTKHFDDVETRRYAYTITDDRIEVQQTYSDVPGAQRMASLTGVPVNSAQSFSKSLEKLEFSGQDVFTVTSTKSNWSRTCRRISSSKTAVASEPQPNSSLAAMQPESQRDFQEEASPKAPIPDTPKEEIHETRHGQLVIKNIGEFGKGIFLSSKLLFQTEGGYLGIKKVFQIGGNDVALVSNNAGGSGTTDAFFFITIGPGLSPIVSEEFWAQGNVDINPAQQGEKIVIDLGYNTGAHETLIYQGGNFSIHKSAATGTASEDDCNYLFNDIYVDYVKKSHAQKSICKDPPEEVSGMATARAYYAFSNDPRLNLIEFQKIAKASCEQGDWINYSEFKAKVCGVASSNSQSHPISDNTESGGPAEVGSDKLSSEQNRGQSGRTKLTSLRNLCKSPRSDR